MSLWGRITSLEIAVLKVTDWVKTAEAEIARLTAERDEARATKDMHKERQQILLAENTDLRDQIVLLKHEAAVQGQWRCDYDCDHCKSDDFPGEEPEGLVGVVGLDNERRPGLAKAFVVNCPVCGEVGRVPFDEWEEGVGLMGPKEQAFWDQHVAEKHPSGA